MKARICDILVKIKGLLAKILFSCVIFLLLIIALEIVLRKTHLFGARISWAEPDPILAYRFTPGREYWSNQENDHPITGKINSYGWRDKEWSLQKAANTYRIAVLGDSFVEALQVESDKTFLALTERKLSEKYDLKAELMNFGRPAYTQTEQLIVLKRDVAQFSPDMVLLFFFPGNDVAEVSKKTCRSSSRPFYNISESGELILDTSFVETSEYKTRCFVNLFKQHSALISFFCERYNSWRFQKRPRNKSAGLEREKVLLRGALSLCTDNPNERFVQNYRLNKMLIKAMSEFCRENEIQFILVTLAIPTYLPQVEKQFKLLDPTFNANFFEDDMSNFAKSIGVEHLGLQRTFRQSYEENSVALHWSHLNYEGHKVVTNALTNKLKTRIR